MLSRVSKFLEPLLVALLAIFAPAKSMILASLVMVLIDLLTGLIAARKRQEPITSSGLKRTIIKIAVYEVAILLAFLAETYLILDVLPVAKVVSSFVGITELKSIYENLNEIGGGDLLKSLISKLNGPNDQV